MHAQLNNAEDGLGTLRFYASIKLKNALSIAFFATVALVLINVALMDPSAKSVLAVFASTLLLWGGVWLEWRRGWPRLWHGPVCELDATGITFWPRKSRQQFLPWDDLQAVGSDMSDNSSIFHTKKPQQYDRPYLLFFKRPPYVSQDVKSPHGEYLLNVLDRYWDEETKAALIQA